MLKLANQDGNDLLKKRVTSCDYSEWSSFGVKDFFWCQYLVAVQSETQSNKNADFANKFLRELCKVFLGQGSAVS